jgi:hypothetical protein
MTRAGAPTRTAHRYVVERSPATHRRHRGGWSGAAKAPASNANIALQRRGRDSNSRYANQAHNGFRDRRIQPLCHPSRATPDRLMHRTRRAGRPAGLQSPAWVRCARPKSCRIRASSRTERAGAEAGGASPGSRCASSPMQPGARGLRGQACTYRFDCSRHRRSPDRHPRWGIDWCGWCQALETRMRWSS